MGANVLPRARTRVAIERMAEKLEHSLHEAPRHDLVDDPAVDAHELDERLEAWRLPFSLQIGFPEAELSRRQEAPREIVILDDELGLRARCAAIEIHLAPVRQDGCERSGAQAGRRPENLAHEVRHIGRKRLLRAFGHVRSSAPRHRRVIVLRKRYRGSSGAGHTTKQPRSAASESSGCVQIRLRRSCAYSLTPASPQARPDHSRAASDRS